jgi:hypothetical protein
VKNGTNTDHPLTGRELRGLRKLKAEQKPPSRYIFMTERGAPFTPDGFYKLMIRLGERAKVAAARLRFFPIWRVHPGLAVAATNSGYPFSICHGSIFSFAGGANAAGTRPRSSA